MQSVPREWLDFLRQQFPKDSRIQLTEIGGNPRPISPGSTGKLDYIDDAGQFHVKWDNGCTLALVLGEDRFSVYLPEPQTFKLYMPLTADFYGRDEWGDMSEDGEEWDGHTLMDYEGQILSALVKNRVPEENESGLMRWYGEDDSVDHKVRSAVFTVEVRNRQLWGVAECRVAGELTPEELTILKEYYGNPVGYRTEQGVVADSMFRREELEDWLARKGLAVRWEDGIYDRLSSGGYQKAADNGPALKSCRIWQLGPSAPAAMRFIGLDRMSGEYGGPDLTRYQAVFDGTVSTNSLDGIWEAFCRRSLGSDGQPLAISDLVELYDDSGSEFYYVDRTAIVPVQLKAPEQESGMTMTL